MSNVAEQLEAAANAAEASGLDPIMTVRALVAEVRKAVADLKADDAPKRGKGK